MIQEERILKRRKVQGSPVSNLDLSVSLRSLEVLLFSLSWNIASYQSCSMLLLQKVDT
jgi:hypothetical protein